MISNAAWWSFLVAIRYVIPPHPPSACHPGTRHPAFQPSDRSVHPQFRMHASKHIDVYVSAAAKPVIEKCTAIHFSEYPANPPVSGDGPRNVSYQIPRETRACIA